MAVRATGADDRQRLLLVEPCGRLTLEPIGVPPHLGRHIVKQTLPLEPCIKEALRRPGRAQLPALVWA